MNKKGHILNYLVCFNRKTLLANIIIKEETNEKKN
jgi:hypothetical protein